MRLDRAFEPLMERFDLDSLEDDPSVTFGVFRDGRLGYANAAWDTFARTNGAPGLPDKWPLGRDLLEAVPEDLQQFYREGWEWAAESGHPWSHTFDCSSPDEYRRHRMTCYGLGEGEGILVVNSVVVSSPWPSDAPSTQPHAEYREANGSSLQCSSCRRTKHVATGRWDWVPEWVQRWPDEARPTLCDVCMSYHYSPDVRGVPGAAR